MRRVIRRIITVTFEHWTIRWESAPKDFHETKEDETEFAFEANHFTQEVALESDASELAATRLQDSKPQIDE